MIPVQESRERHQLFAPPRSALTMEGAPSVFRPRLIRRLGGYGVAGLFLVFLGVGLAIALLGLAGTVGPWRDGMRENNHPSTFLGALAFGSVFLLVTLRMLQLVLAGQNNQSLFEEKPKSRKQPWLLDHPWKPEMKPDYSGEAGGSVLGRIAFLGLIGLFNIAWSAPGLFFKAILVVFDLFALLIVYDSFQKIVQTLRHVQPSVRWATLPAFLGGELQATLLLQRALHVRGPVRATLRCVQDEEGPPDPESGISQIQAFVIYEQTREIPSGSEKLREVPLIFDIPKDLPGTRLQRREATYWQVALEIPLLGPDFEAVFLAPVYAPRG